MSDPPPILYWRLPDVRSAQGLTLKSVLLPALADMAESRDNFGNNANHVVCRRGEIPFGVTGWSVSPAGPWLPLDELPMEWVK